MSQERLFFLTWVILVLPNWRTRYFSALNGLKTDRCIYHAKILLSVTASQRSILMDCYKPHRTLWFYASSKNSTYLLASISWVKRLHDGHWQDLLCSVVRKIIPASCLFIHLCIIYIRARSHTTTTYASVTTYQSTCKIVWRNPQRHREIAAKCQSLKCFSNPKGSLSIKDGW